ncbi:hypothetical protein KIH31_17965 [Paenarthrobacter sp. DKR-5]|uniref:hypothetical protein n=1 Tax=Paenarthrobacter sp. DKR-5 TaxID=2835535 RepID=UPI001BDC89A2|nr:hypothetical protein [Paenarthrobacter sp. DKR-5]MBT1004476.1 hypothetical protein [Paenarthrobacter sp. DKR-5]
MRGAGLGNEIFPWAKAYLASRALGLQLVDPAWRLNPRQYYRELGGGYGTAGAYFAALSAPGIDISTDAYTATGEVDYFRAMSRIAQTHNFHRRQVLVHSSGMAGGYLGIRRARAFLRLRLLSNAAVLHGLDILEGEDPAVRIGVHVRGGDFGQAEEVTQSDFNQAIPLAWYSSQLDSLSHLLNLPLRVYVATNSSSQAIVDALTVRGEPPVVLKSSATAELSILTSCDLLITSISSFSLLAAFLSDAPYVWHRDQLGEAGGWLSIWGHETHGHGGIQTGISRTLAGRPALRVHRGLANDDRPTWAPWLLDYLSNRAFLRVAHLDLIQYGVVPASADSK